MVIGSLPAWPVNATCAILLQADRVPHRPGTTTRQSALVAAAAKVVHLLMSPSDGPGGKCIATAPEGPGEVPGDGPGGIGAWSYQSCTETLHLFSSRHSAPNRNIRDYVLDVPGWVLFVCP